MAALDLSKLPIDLPWAPANGKGKKGTRRGGNSSPAALLEDESNKRCVAPCAPVLRAAAWTLRALAPSGQAAAPQRPLATAT